MKLRKPRFAKYELDRLGARDLRGLCDRLGIRVNAVEKRELVNAVLNSGKVTVIAAPEPVEYQCIQILRSMGIKQLKGAMADAGVFFDPRDVVEKEDMVQIFVNSGRIVFLEKEEQKTNQAHSDYGHAPRNDEDLDADEIKQPSTDEDASSDWVEEIKDTDEQYVTHEDGELDTDNSQIAEDSSSSVREEPSSAQSSVGELTFAQCSVGELRRVARQFNVDISMCIEKKEMVDLIIAAVGRNSRS